MKKLLFVLSAAMLVGAVLGGITACETNSEPRPENSYSCWVITKVTEEPTLLYAKSWINGMESYYILENFKSQYGEENIRYYATPSVPYDAPVKKVSPDCYEFTITIDYSQASAISTQNLLSRINSFMAAKIDGSTVIIKWYDWAGTEEEEESLIYNTENRYKALAYELLGEDGTIISVITQNLGSEEIKDMQITFNP